MIIAITDKIAALLKKALDKIYLTVNNIFQSTVFIITTLGTLFLMLYTIMQPNLFTLILSITLYIWGEKRENSIITILGAFLVPLLVICYLKS